MLLFVISYLELSFSSESIRICEFYVFIDIITLQGIHLCILETMGVRDQGEWSRINGAVKQIIK